MSERYSIGFPNGWFQVGYSSELAASDVRPLRYFGRDLVLFRGEDGRARVLDAYCAHLGAHLGYGGAVQGSCLSCPFHGWRYDHTGQCVEIPYASKVPKGASVRSYATAENSGIVMMWFHADGAEPQWEPPVLVPEWGSPGWAPAYVTWSRECRTHAQDTIENGYDPAHFHFVHGDSQLPRDYRYWFDGHTAGFAGTIEIPSLTVETYQEAWFSGLGFGYGKAVGAGETRYVASPVPIDVDLINLQWSILPAASTPTDPTGEVSRAMAEGVGPGLMQDLAIWEHKRYLERPLLCDGDGPIGRFRKWAEQFYSPAAAHT
jgi:nitrite reductase/ring-hydroxylating ferredoxin subunit